MTEPQRMGFRSRNPNAMTPAERQSKRRRKLGVRQVQLGMGAELAASLLYIRNEWGIRTNREAVEAAVRFLALCTRQGLTRLPQSIDD